MSGVEQARPMLAMAVKDLNALVGMRDRQAFADEIFGFHAQQAIEKSLKAWLMLTDDDYPLTHNIIVLLGLLEDGGADVAGFWHLVRYSAFAVQFRYEEMESLIDDLDREEVIRQVAELMRHVEGLMV